MSIWYQLDVTAMAKDKSPIAKFFNLEDSFENVRTDRFEFSFGGKNAPSLTLWKIVKQNPEMVFLIKQSVECDTVEWFLMKWDTATDKQQSMLIQTFGSVNNLMSKKVLDDLEKKYPGAAKNHLSGTSGNQGIDWSTFIYLEQATDMLAHAEEYKETVDAFEYLGIKMYMVECELFGSKDWQGPYTLEKANALVARYADNPDISNMKIVERKPK